MFLVLVTACGGSSSSNPGQKIDEIRGKSDALESRLQKLEQQINKTEIQRSLEYVAVLTPTDTGYSTLRMDVGVLVVSIEDIQPYASGSRIKLRFGNPTAARIQGLKLQLDWGGKGDLNSREHVLTEALFPGSWVTVQLPLESVTPSEFNMLRLRYLGHQGVYLNGR
jgi:hypothetical protein